MKETQRTLVNALRRNYQAEMEGAATYRALAEREPNGRRADVIRWMAEAEEGHAQRWADRLRELGEQPPAGPFKPRQSILLSAQIGSVDVALRKLEASEAADIQEYQEQATTLGDTTTRQILNSLIQDEQEHERSLHAMAGPSPDPHVRLTSLMRGERHVTTGTWIGDAIYGVNDGLGAVFGIVSGVSGATGGGHVVLLAGLAGMVASAVSMGSGAYLAAKSEAEVHQAEFERERREIQDHPEEEKEELSLFYQLKGLTEEEANFLVERVSKDPERMLEMLAQEELGLSHERLPKPWLAAITASLSTAVGAFIPIIPFFFLEGVPAMVLAAVISLIAHFAVGAAKSLITTRSWWASGLEMTLVGILAGIVTYIVGVLAGPLAG
jgi:VIT1/CCC1 family predicted Fe2+/Mn2+ transporter/rubrerythrin